MMHALRHPSLHTRFMLPVILVLCGLIAVELLVLDSRADVASAGNDPAPGAVEHAAGGEPIVIPSLPSYRELLTRPLFMETRRPAPVARQAASSRRANPGDKWKLTGIIVSGEDSHIFVQGLRDKAVRRLEIGDSLDGWVLDQVAPDHAVLHAGAEESRLALREEPDAP